MTVLLTGGSGFLGSHVAEQLSKAGRPVRVLVRRTSDTSFLQGLPGVELAEGSVGDLASIERAAKGAQGIIHAAGLVRARSPEEFRSTNTGGTENVLRAALGVGGSLKRVVLVSSLAAARPSLDGTPVRIEHGSAPVTHYGRSKLAAEQAALQSKDAIPVTILRPPAIYGPRDRECLAFFMAVKTGVLPYFGTTENRVSMIYGADAAAACIRALDVDVPSGSVFFLDDGEPRTLGELIGEIEGVMGKRAWLRFPLPRPVLEVVASGNELIGRARRQAVMLTRDKLNELYAPHWVCDASETRSALAWEPKIRFSEGARATYAWYREHRWI
jgi:nucleoside-diphosphate-sugar epimerase